MRGRWMSDTEWTGTDSWHSVAFLDSMHPVGCGVTMFIIHQTHRHDRKQQYK